jgi:hypothetical protein
VLQGGRVTYTDNFIKPNYTANLVAITGTIGAFGTHSTTPAPVDVAAKLAANGPVSIKGQVNPLIKKPSLDLTASAHDVELTNLTPYSSKYAGYPITKGKLNVDLHSPRTITCSSTSSRSAITSTTRARRSFRCGWRCRC